MKMFFYALLAAAAIQIIYFVAEFAIGYLKTLMFRPNIVNSWESAEILQSEVAFGGTFSPFLFPVAFVGLTAGFWILLVAYKKGVRARKQERGA